MLIAGGRLIDPRAGIDALRDIRIEDGVVTEIGEHLAAHDGEEIVDARNAYVAPGFIDMHVHLRDPGFPEKETLETGTLAAARGGFTAVACMPNTAPPLDDPSLVTRLRADPPSLVTRLRADPQRAAAERTGFASAGQRAGATLAEGVHCRVYPIAAITRGRGGEEPLDYAALARAGAVAFSDDGNTVMNARVLRDAALAAREVPGVFISHAEDANLKGDGVMHEGAVSRALGLPGSPGLAEDAIVARDLLIARETGKRWHIAHLSTRTAAALVAAAKRAGIAVTCEVTPHHLLLTGEAVRELGAAAKVNPPLRTEDDVLALRDAVRDGTIDAFASDHAPHTAAEKSGDVRSAAVGFTGLEIALGAYALALPDIPLARFVELLAVNPARILGIPGGTLAPGSPADVTIFADRPWRVDPTRFASKGRSTPFAAQTLPRRAVATVVNGHILRNA